ncbi:MAG: elongation factor G [Hyphomicrobiaceae bacterium]
MTHPRRNIGIMAHVDAGKTTLTERILFNTGRIHKLGNVHDGNAEMDFRALERKHGITISAAATSCDWRDATITIIDTPGHVDFTIEVERSLRVLDSAIAVFSAVSGVEPQSETVWRQADRFGVPRLCFINKMDQVGANFDAAVVSLKERLGALPLVAQLPIGNEADFHGLVDLVSMTALAWKKGVFEPLIEDIPPDMHDKVAVARQSLIEQIVEGDDAALELYLEKGDVFDTETTRKLIRAGCLLGRFQPVLCGSAFRNVGVQPLLDAIVDYCPGPADRPVVTGVNPGTGDIEQRAPTTDAPFVGLVSKVQMRRTGALSYVRIYSGRMDQGMSFINGATGAVERISRIKRMHADAETDIAFAEAGDVVAVVGLKATGAGETLCEPRHPLVLDGFDCPDPVIEAVIEPLTLADQHKLSSALHGMSREDPSLRISVDAESGQTLVAGMGELHLTIAVETLKEDYNVDAVIGAPRVAYREAITARSEIDHTHKKQNGGQGQFARMKLVFEPLGNDETGLLFEDRTVGGTIPKEFVPAIEKALIAAMHEGPLAGYPLLGLRATLVDGAFHSKDSSAMAFELATRDAAKLGLTQAEPVLLEPVMEVTVTTPEDHLGAVIGDLQSRRGTVLATDIAANAHEVSAHVPLANMFNYVNAVRSLSHGRAVFTMRFGHYGRVPASVADTVLSCSAAK